MAAEEWARLKRRDRQVGLTTDLAEEWVDAVRTAKVPEEFAHIDADLRVAVRFVLNRTLSFDSEIASKLNEAFG